MEIRINTDILTTNKLTISEYLYLQLLYKGYTESEHYKVLDTVDEEALQQRGFIKILKDEIVLRTKGVELFEGKDLFLKFLNTFPIKAPSGRFLSPLRDDTSSAKALKGKWKRIFKNAPHLEQRAIDVLEAELRWRKKTNSLEYIHSAMVWLNQGDYENYAYLLDEEKQREGNYRDLM